MTFEEYLASPGISASLIKSCSFGAYEGFKCIHAPKYESAAMEFGSAVHCAVLEPEHFYSRYVTPPFDAPKKPTKAQLDAKSPSDKTLASIEWWKNFDEKNKGKIVLDSEEIHKIERIRKNCLKISSVREALDTFKREATYFWGEGDKFKARLDLVDDKNGVIIDLKTTRDAGPREFAKQCVSLRYHLQLYHYASGLRSRGLTPSVYAIAIESESGEVAMYSLDKFVFNEITKAKYENALKIAENVLKMTECPAKYPNEIIDLEMPLWALEDVV